MSAYGPLAPWYDTLTRDVDYAAFADYYERCFARHGGEIHTLLDFCCGTGTLTALLAERGYELIAVDGSPDMLMQAQSKADALPDGCIRPLLLCQDAAALDLYGTVDAAFCSLDGMDYLPPDVLCEALRRLRLFIRPDGLLIFDVRTPASFRALDGQLFLDETDDVLCLWRAEFDAGSRSMRYGMDLFSRAGAHWLRDSEEHVEYAHEPEWLLEVLRQAGFAEAALHADGPQAEAGRLFVTAVRGK